MRDLMKLMAMALVVLHFLQNCMLRLSGIYY